MRSDRGRSDRGRIHGPRTEAGAPEPALGVPESRAPQVRAPELSAPYLRASRGPLPIVDARPGRALDGPSITTAPHVASPGWETARSILAIRLDSMGDVLMTTPALRALRDSGPARRITLLTSQAGAAIAQLVPAIDEAIVYEAPWLKATPAGAAPEADLAMIDCLRARGFDAAVIFTVYSQNPLPAALVCHLAGIPLRLAYCRENPYQLLTDRLPELEPERLVRHEVRRQLDLVAAVGATTPCDRLEVSVPTGARRWAETTLRALGVGNLARSAGTRPWVVLHPGASAPSRRYPPDLFAAAARSLVKELGCDVVFTGSQHEVPLVEEIRGSMQAPSHSLAGRLPLPEMAAVIEAAPLLVTGNTGPAHLAAAVGTPVVDVYALTNPQHTPWGVPNRVLFHDVPCRNCYASVCPMGHHDCVRGVEPAYVVAAAAALLAETSVGQRRAQAAAPAAAEAAR